MPTMHDLLAALTDTHVAVADAHAAAVESAVQERRADRPDAAQALSGVPALDFDGSDGDGSG